MGLLICVMAGAVLLGWITGGSLARLGEVPLHGWRLVLGALAAVVVGVLISSFGGPVDGVVGEIVSVTSLVTAAACLLLLMARNRRVEGIPLIALGLLLNAIVIGANGAMPVSLYAESRAGVHSSVLTEGGTHHEPADDTTRLRLIGDVIPVALPVHPETASAGDMLIVAGAGLLITAGMHARRKQERRRSPPSTTLPPK